MTLGPSDVEIQKVPHRLVVGRVSGLGARDRVVHIGVAGDEDVHVGVTVDVRDCGARVPPVRSDAGVPRALGERAVAVVPEQPVVRVARRVVARSRHEQVGRAVPVQVGRDAAAPAQGEIGACRLADILEPTADVAVEPARRQPAAGLPPGDVRLGVRVDRVQVEPAVAVVVEPADATAHHRGLVARDAEAERLVAEVEPDPRRDVRQAERRLQRRRRRHDLPCRFPADPAHEVAVADELELEGRRGVPGVAALHDVSGEAPVRRGLTRARERRDDGRRALAVAADETEADALRPIRRHVDGADACRVDPCPEIVEPRSRRTSTGPRAVSCPQRLDCVLEIDDEVARDSAAGGVVGRRDALRGEDRDLWDGAAVERRGDGRSGSRRDAGNDNGADRGRDGERHGDEPRPPAWRREPREHASRLEDKDDRARGADDRERGEHGHLRCELARPRARSAARRGTRRRPRMRAARRQTSGSFAGR